MERWNLFQNKVLYAGFSAGLQGSWNCLSLSQIQALPDATDAFVSYSPSDGGTEGLVPLQLPRRIPHTRTHLACCHDATHLYVYLTGFDPDPKQVLPAWSGEREDYLLAFQLDGERGIYFGMNEKGEHICQAQEWDPDLFTDADRAGPIWGGGKEPVLSDGYEACFLPHDGCMTAVWKIDRSLLASGMHADSIRFQAGRSAYRANEWVVFGDAVQWRPRSANLAALVFVESVPQPRFPTVQRVDLEYDPVSETGVVCVEWTGPTSTEELAAFAKRSPHYEPHMPNFAIALNMQEEILPIAAHCRSQSIAIPDGWNRLEVMSGFASPLEISFAKYSGNRLTPRAFPHSAHPTRAHMQDTFDQLHEKIEVDYRGNGMWSWQEQQTCLCHGTTPYMLPYLYACQEFDVKPVYRERIQEGAGRLLAYQTEEGWFPDLCIYPDGRGPLACGAFGNGSCGEAIALAARVLNDETYLDAAVRSAPVYQHYAHEMNQNYAAFVLWHLACLYEKDPRGDYLETMRYVAFHMAGRDVMPCGSIAGHNYYTAYGNITLKGLARFLEVMPRIHPDYPRLRELSVRMGNTYLARQQTSGVLSGRNRKYIGDIRGVCTGLLYLALALPKEDAMELAPSLMAQYDAICRNETSFGYQEQALFVALLSRYLRYLEE